MQRDRLMNDYSKTMLFGYSVAAAHEDSLLKKKSPYEVPSSPLTGPHTRSASSMLSGSGKRSRPQSAVTYGPRAQTSGAGQKPRPHSATVRSGSASGKNYPVFKPVATTKPAWDDRWWIVLKWMNYCSAVMPEWISCLPSMLHWMTNTLGKFFKCVQHWCLMGFGSCDKYAWILMEGKFVCLQVSFC